MTMTNASHCEMLSHHKNRYYLTEEINHFPTSAWEKKKKGNRSRSFAPLRLPLLLLPPLLSIRRYLRCLFPHYLCPIALIQKRLSFSLILSLHRASQTLHAWNSGGDLFLTACLALANQAPRPPYLRAQPCDSPTAWWRVLWTDTLEWYQTTSQHHHSPLNLTQRFPTFFIP